MPDTELLSLQICVSVSGCWLSTRRTAQSFIFHAAAHKHEPLMAMEPVEAITNHVLGTQSLLTMATAIRWCVWEICSVAFGSVIHTFEK